MNLLVAVMILILSAGNVFAKLTTEKVEYKDGEQVLEGYIVYETSLVKNKKKLPGLIIVHNWMGVGEYVMMRAEQMANLGYIAFVADIYGKGIRPKDQKEAGALAGKYKAGDRKELRSRALAAFNAIKSNKYVEANKISAMGYCFGGTVALDLARMGLPLVGVVSFHGGLAAVNADEAKKIKTKLLILHGAIDPFVPAPEVAEFQKELNAANVNYELVMYSGAVHSFTEKSAGDNIKAGAAYNDQADRRSFIAMKNFLSEVNN